MSELTPDMTNQQNPLEELNYNYNYNYNSWHRILFLG